MTIYLIEIDKSDFINDIHVMLVSNKKNKKCELDMVNEIWNYLKPVPL